MENGGRSMRFSNPKCIALFVRTIDGVLSFGVMMLFHLAASFPGRLALTF